MRRALMGDGDTSGIVAEIIKSEALSFDNPTGLNLVFFQRLGARASNFSLPDFFACCWQRQVDEMLVFAHSPTALLRRELDNMFHRSR